MEKIIKTPNQVAEQIVQWFLKYHSKSEGHLAEFGLRKKDGR